MAYSKFLIIGIFVAVLVAIALLSLYFYISISTSALIKQLAQPNVTVNSLPITGKASIGSTAAYSYDNNTYIVESAIVDYNFQNTTNSTAVLNVYKKNPIQHIYLINVGDYCYECLNEGAINVNLSSYLTQYGFNLTNYSYINLNQVYNSKPNSILIIPSGLMPCVLIPELQTICAISNATTTNVTSLLSEGDTIVYVGLNFSSFKNYNAGTTPTNRSISQDLIAANLNTTKPRKTATASGFYFSNRSFSFFNGSTYGPVAYTYFGNGTFIAFPNYPDLNSSLGGWSNASELSHDIAYALYSRFWFTLVAQSPLEQFNGKGQLPLFTTNDLTNGMMDTIRNSTMGYSGTINDQINRSYSLVDLQLFNQSSFIAEQLPFRMKFQNNGTLGLPAIVGEGQPVKLLIRINPYTPTSMRIIGNPPRYFQDFHLNIYNSTLGLLYPPYSPISIPEFNITIPTTNFTVFTLKPGYYSASLQDRIDGIYESALFYVPPFNVIPVALNFNNGTFALKVTNNNQLVSGVNYTAKVDGIYSFNGIVTDGKIKFSLPSGSVMPYGYQTIALNMLNLNYSVPIGIYSKPPEGSINPFYIEFGIAGLAILIINLVLKAPTRDEYFIDVPLFPPAQKTEVKATAASILSIFDTINEHFRWKYMPLTAEEVKSGISSNIRYNNMPIMITMGNSTEILYKMANRGEVEIISPYFMPSKWKEASHHDIEYLVIFRKLRDFAVKNAILFTDLDSGEAADMVMTNRGVQSHLYIYSKTSGIKDVKVSPGVRTFIVFLDAESRAQFIDKLSDTNGVEAEKLRIGISTATITLIDTENLGQLLY
jgi:hypothetical protein